MTSRIEQFFGETVDGGEVEEFWARLLSSTKGKITDVDVGKVVDAGGGGFQALEEMEKVRQLGRIDAAMQAKFGAEMIKQTVRKAAEDVLQDVPGLSPDDLCGPDHNHVQVWERNSSWRWTTGGTSRKGGVEFVNELRRDVDVSTTVPYA